METAPIRKSTRWMCAKKVAYETLKRATTRAKNLGQKFDTKFHVYTCNVCSQFHLTTQPNPKEPVPVLIDTIFRETPDGIMKLDQLDPKYSQDIDFLENEVMKLFFFKDSLRVTVPQEVSKIIHSAIVGLSAKKKLVICSTLRDPNRVESVLFVLARRGDKTNQYLRELVRTLQEEMPVQHQ